MNKFGERLRLLRKRRNLSQINLSTKVGMCQEAISSYERGTTSPSIEALYRFQSYFNVSSDYLLGISDDENHISYNTLNTFEVYLVNNFRHLSLSEQKLLLKISDDFCESHDLKLNGVK